MIKQIYVSGIGYTLDDLGMILTNESEFPAAAPKETTVDIPGRSGSLDLSGALTGDVEYEDLEQTLVFVADGKDFASLYRDFVNRLSGRLLDYVLTWEPEYTYRGRWRFGDVEKIGYNRLKITVTTRTDPYRLKGTITYLVNAAGGITVNLPAGRMRVRPLIDVSHRTLVSKDDQTWELQPGASRIRDLYLSGPNNVLTINSYPEYGSARWEDDPETLWTPGEGETWAYEVAGGNPVQDSPTWADDADETWAPDADRRWIEELYPALPSDEYAVGIQFDWKDL